MTQTWTKRRKIIVAVFALAILIGLAIFVIDFVIGRVIPYEYDDPLFFEIDVTDHRIFVSGSMYGSFSGVGIMTIRVQDDAAYIKSRIVIRSFIWDNAFEREFHGDFSGINHIYTEDSAGKTRLIWQR
ncbi:hypothetical protein LJC55_01835 [Eubacteriales bacterium OttesenSCG-928-N14]|nr:hypothetical protein [Eubacteriales bacterium OttesenSCG-928-N14]